jgi:hypothetical protein
LGLVVFSFTSLLVMLGVLAGLDLLEGREHRRSPQGAPPCGDPVVDAMTQWDGQWFLRIATQGYSYDRSAMSSVAFFPAYPVLLRALSQSTGMREALAALLVAHAFLLASLVLLAAYVRRRYGSEGRQVTPWAVLALGLFPPGFFMRMAYSESLFLFAAILAMYGMERRWPPVCLALIVGGATAVRLAGVALLVPLLIYLWQQRESRPRAIAQAACLTPLALWGLLAYMVFQWIAVGEPLAFVRAQTFWQSRPAVGLGEKLLSYLIAEPLWGTYVPASLGSYQQFRDGGPAWCNLQAANPIIFAGSVALVAWGALRGWLTRYEVWLSAGLLGIPYISRGFDMCMASQARFASAVFPLYLVSAQLLRRAPLAISVGIAALSAAYLTIYAAMFAGGYFAI